MLFWVVFWGGIRTQKKKEEGRIGHFPEVEEESMRSFRFVAPRKNTQK